MLHPVSVFVELIKKQRNVMGVTEPLSKYLSGLIIHMSKE